MTRIGYLRLLSYPSSVYRHFYPKLVVLTYGGGGPNDVAYESMDVEHRLSKSEAATLNKQARSWNGFRYRPGDRALQCLSEDRAIKAGTEKARSVGCEILFRGRSGMPVPDGIVYGPDWLLEMFEDGRPTYDEFRPVLEQIRAGSL